MLPCIHTLSHLYRHTNTQRYTNTIFFTHSLTLTHTHTHTQTQTHKHHALPWSIFEGANIVTLMLDLLDVMWCTFKHKKYTHTDRQTHTPSFFRGANIVTLILDPAWNGLTRSQSPFSLTFCDLPSSTRNASLCTFLNHQGIITSYVVKPFLFFYVSVYLCDFIS